MNTRAKNNVWDYIAFATLVLITLALPTFVVNSYLVTKRRISKVTRFHMICVFSIACLLMLGLKSVCLSLTVLAEFYVLSLYVSWFRAVYAFTKYKVILKNDHTPDRKYQNYTHFMNALGNGLIAIDGAEFTVDGKTYVLQKAF